MAANSGGPRLERPDSSDRLVRPERACSRPPVDAPGHVRRSPAVALRRVRDSSRRPAPTSPDEGLFRPVSDAPQYPDRRRERADAREGRARDDDRAAARIEKPGPAELGRRRRARAPGAHHPPRAGRLPPRPDQLRQDLRLPRSRWRRTAAASTPRRCASWRTRPTSGCPRSSPPAPSASPPARRRSTPTPRSSAAPWRRRRCAATSWCSTSRTGSPTPTAATTGPGCVLTGEYREMHLISAAEAYLLLKPLVADAKKLDRRQPQAAVAARRAAGAGPRRGRAAADAGRRLLPQGRLRRRRRARPAPARARSASSTARCPRPPGASVIERFTRGELEVLVTTDVIGHGINVPATTVLFAETTKFDGVERRALRTWETAQIAGRAGRYGLTGHGSVGVLAGVTGLKPDAGLLGGRRRGRPRRRDERPAQARAAAAPGARRPGRLRAGRPARGAHPLDGVGPRRHPRPGDDRRRRHHA